MPRSDVVKSRIQNSTRTAGTVPKYNWAWPAVMTVMREEGFGALYKGFLPKVLRLGPGGKTPSSPRSVVARRRTDWNQVASSWSSSRAPWSSSASCGATGSSSKEEHRPSARRRQRPCTVQSSPERATVHRQSAVYQTTSLAPHVFLGPRQSSASPVPSTWHRPKLWRRFGQRAYCGQRQAGLAVTRRADSVSDCTVGPPWAV